MLSCFFSDMGPRALSLVTDHLQVKRSRAKMLSFSFSIRSLSSLACRGLWRPEYDQLHFHILCTHSIQRGPVPSDLGN